MKKSTEESDIEEIRKGFEMFDTNDTGKIIPSEIKESMESMNIQEKNPFIYEIISSLSTSENIDNKEGISIDDLVNYVYEKVNDNESNIGLKQLFDALKDPNTNKISMHTFMKLAKDYGEDDFSSDELRYLLEKTQLGGDDLTFEEFSTIMKGNFSSISVQSEDNNNENNKEDKKKNSPLSNIPSEEVTELKKDNNEIEIKEKIDNNINEIKQESNDNIINKDNSKDNQSNIKDEIITENKVEETKEEPTKEINTATKVEKIEEIKDVINEKPLIEHKVEKEEIIINKIEESPKLEEEKKDILIKNKIILEEKEKKEEKVETSTEKKQSIEEKPKEEEIKNQKPEERYNGRFRFRQKVIENQKMDPTHVTTVNNVGYEEIKVTNSKKPKFLKVEEKHVEPVVEVKEEKQEKKYNRFRRFNINKDNNDNKDNNNINNNQTAHEKRNSNFSNVSSHSNNSNNIGYKEISKVTEEKNSTTTKGIYRTRRAMNGNNNINSDIKKEEKKDTININEKKESDAPKRYHRRYRENKISTNSEK